MIDSSDFTPKSNNAWSLGSYNEIALFFLPVSALLVRLCDISSRDHILDVACGTGKTAITAARRTGAKVTGIDFTPQMLTQAKIESELAGTEDIEWKEGDVEDLPFGDDSFDDVLPSFGHMFAPHPEVAIKEMLRVTKSGGRIAFATWPPEHANGKLFDVMTKHVHISYASPGNTASANTIPPPSSPMQWGTPEFIHKRLGVDRNVKNIHFERGAINKPVLSPNHYWKMASTNGGTLIQVIQTIKDPQKVENLKKDILQAIAPYIHDNVLRLDYLVTFSTKT
jgi:SAM-dependent methyltransferase